MISRRLLRIKILQTLYSYFQSGEVSINQAEKELLFGINKSYDLYYFLFQLIFDVIKYAEDRIELSRNKLIPTYEDLNPNRRFVDNKIIAQLYENENLNNYLRQTKLSWVNYPELIKQIYNTIVNSEEYKSYMNTEDRSYDNDKKFLIHLYENVLYECDDLYSTLEEQSIYWIDSIDFMLSMCAKTVKKYRIGFDQTTPLLPLYKNEDDKEFVKRLFRKVLLNQVDYKKIIEDHTKNWDLERIANTDICILLMAISEVIEFPSIPVKVTLNEYIDLAKLFSTEKSSVFINGVLDKIIETLRAQNKFSKTGRGLIGEN